MDDRLMIGYESQVQALMGTVPGTDDLRAQALKEFGLRGFPTGKTEDWRYSDMRVLRNRVYALAAPATRLPDLPEPLGDVSARFVFVNGRYVEELSDLGDLWQAVQIRPLANHFMSNADRVGELVRGDDGVAFLNTALLRDGIVLNIPAGIEIDDPIEILHVMTGAEAAAAHIRHVVELGEGAAAHVVERFVGDAAAYWTNAIFQARVAESARLSHVRVQEEGAAALHTSKVYVNVDAEGSYTGVGFSVGGSVARFENHVRLLGEEANAVVDGVALAATGQSHDTLNHVSHKVPAAVSDQVFRSIADSRGKTSFAGRVTVDKGAQGTDAKQSFKALVFDRTAEANAKPELEIYADDVKCAHGATVGELDDKAIYYLTSRGIDPATARQMLVAAFTADALIRVPFEAVRDALLVRIDAWMADRAGKGL